MAHSGEQFGPYRIVKQLGKGGMGVVYEADELALGRRVALKVVSPEYAGDPSFRTRFSNEARAQAALDSAHIVSIFAHGEINGSLYIASQLVPDGDLSHLMRTHGAPPPAVAIDLIAQIASGLAVAHAGGVIHRDLKPANVLVRMRDQEVSAYLTDFGIARLADSDHNLTAAGFAVGTPSYMAPELHTGSSASEQTDIYSLGCLLWATLVGRAPYSGDTDYQLVQAHLSGPIPQVVATGPFEHELNRILATAMAKDPAHRYRKASQMRDDLRWLARGQAPERTVPAAAGGVAPRGAQHPTPASPPPPSPASPSPASPAFGAPSPAPDAPSPAPPPPPGAQSFAPVGSTPTPSGAQRRRSNTGLVVGIVAGAVVLLLLLIAIIVAVARGGGEGGGEEENGGRGDTATQSTTGRDDRAIANITAALMDTEELETPVAECMAEELVRSQGVDGLIEAGMIDDELEMQPETQWSTAGHGSFLGATFGCILAGE